MSVSVGLALCLTAVFCGGAYAEEPASNVQKTAVAARSLELDRSTYTDGSVYDNASPEHDVVKVGVAYNTSAVDYAELTNVSGGGFDIGYYNETREFVKVTDNGSNSVAIARADQFGACWHILIDASYDGLTQARNAAASFGGAVALINGEYRVIYGSFYSENAANDTISLYGLHGTAYRSGAGSFIVINLNNGGCLFLTDDANTTAAVTAAGDGALTLFQGKYYRGGFGAFPMGESLLNVINYVNIEDYVKGVIPYEMSSYWPYEALRAQSVCARTYAIYNRDAYIEYGFDLTADTESQVYRGTQDADTTTDAAVDSTAGQYVRYKGEICDIYYFASDGGATEDGQNVFDLDLPYLAGKTDPFEQAVDYSMRSWYAYRSGSDLSWRLARNGQSIDTVTELRPEYSVNGNVIAMTYVDAAGNELRLEGRDCYAFIGLNNCRFSVTQSDGEFEFYGSGWGHNCGMSQWGANAMASVYGYDYEDIIRFYFSGAYIA